MNILYGIVFWVSTAGIAYQIALIRIFSIVQWHHFAYMIISIAMLGFGAGGILPALFPARFAGRGNLFLLLPLTTLLGIGFPASYAVARWAPFEVFEIMAQPARQLACVSALYLIFATPFFLLSVTIALSLMQAAGRVSRLYGMSMLGSGAGALIAVLLLKWVQPQYVPSILGLAMAPAILAAGRIYPRYPTVRVAGCMACLAVAVWVGWVPARISAYKGLSYALQYPDARIVAEVNSPFAVLTAVDSEHIRETPGQVSYAYPWTDKGPIPRQIGLYFDAGGVSPISRFDGNLEPFAYWDYVTPALAYHLTDQPDTLVIGAGGGTDVLGALYHGARHVTAVEVNPDVFRLLRQNQELNAFYGALYERPDVTPVIADGRGFLQSTNRRFDLIHMCLLDSFMASAAGVYALNESYLYTVEALQLCLERLNPGGILAITRWLQEPARDMLKMFATAAEALRRGGNVTPGDSLALIRSWNAATLIVSKSPLSDHAKTTIRDFCSSRGFDLCYLPGISEEEVNRYTVLEHPVYYQFAQAVLGDDPEKAFQEALFYLRPATDDRPYFFRFLKWRSIPFLFRTLGTQWIPFMEWGYIALLATVLQGTAVACLLILLPVFAWSWRAVTQRGRFSVFLYFAGLGYGYMFLEIAMIQRLMLFLAYPIYAVAVVLTGFLIFSGLGAFIADYCRTNFRGPASRFVLVAFVGITLISIGGILGLPWIFRVGAGLPDVAKILVSLTIIAPLAILMGIPFPIGLQRLRDRAPEMLPWAWAINGCCSVIGAALATLIAIHGGFKLVVLAAATMYLIAVLAMRAMEKSDGGVAQ